MTTGKPLITSENGDAILKVLDAPDSSTIAELMAISGLDPTRDIRFSDFAGLDFADADIAGWDFTGAVLTNSNFARVVNIDLAVFSWQTNLDGVMLPEGVTREMIQPYFRNPGDDWAFEGDFVINFDREALIHPEAFGYPTFEVVKMPRYLVSFTGTISRHGRRFRIEAGGVLFFPLERHVYVVRDGNRNLLWVNDYARGKDREGSVRIKPEK